MAYDLRISDWGSDVFSSDLLGYSSIAVPGQPEGMRLALETFGTRSWQQSLGPAIELAQEGMEVDWYLSLMATSAAKDLTRFPASRAMFLPGGFPPAPDGGGAPVPRLKRSEEHTSELQSLMRISYAVFCLKKKTK